MVLCVCKTRSYKKRDIRYLIVKWIKLAVTMMFISFIYLSELVYVISLAFFVLWLVVLVVVTSFFWIPLACIWGPFVILILGLMYYTRIGE